MKQTYLSKKDAKSLNKWFSTRYDKAKQEFYKVSSDNHDTCQNLMDIMIAKNLVFNALGWVTPDLDLDIKEMIPYEDHVLERLARKTAGDS